MSKNEVGELAVVPFAKYRSGTTMNEIITDTFQQTSNYAAQVKANPCYSDVAHFYMYVCLAVGSSKILSAMKEYDQ